MMSPFVRGRAAAALLAPLLLLGVAVPAGAQWRQPAPISREVSPRPAPMHSAAVAGSTAVAVAGAVLGGAAAGVIGGLVGGSLTSRGCNPGDPDGCLGQALPGFVWGVGTGITLGVPLGAHLGGGRRGNLPRSLLVSSALFAAEVVVLNLLVDDGRTEHGEAVRAIAITVPVLQVVSSVYVERSSASR